MSIAAVSRLVLTTKEDERSLAFRLLFKKER